MNRTQYLLLLVMEECGEVAHHCSKAMRFGLDEVQPGQGLSNAERIAAEWSDLFTVVRMLEAETGLSLSTPHHNDMFTKREKVAKYMALSRDRGQLRDTI